MQSMAQNAEEASAAATGLEAQLGEATKLLAQAHMELQQKDSDLSAAQAANTLKVRSNSV